MLILLTYYVLQMWVGEKLNNFHGKKKKVKNKIIQVRGWRNVPDSLQLNEFNLQWCIAIDICS